jgi:LPXTG-motif cell wall-anchored protein
MIDSGVKNIKETKMKKSIKCLLLALLVFVSVSPYQVSAETYGEFQVSKIPAPTPAPTPVTSGGSGVVSSGSLPMTGEQVFVWTLFAGLLLLALVLIILMMRKRKEEEEASHAQS